MEWADRFDAFRSRKVQKAADARLSPWRTEIEAPPRGFQSIGHSWSRRWFDGDFYLAPEPSDVPATSLVFVQSKDGNTGTRNPASLGGGESDQHLIYEGLSRVAADGVLSGAETVRGCNLMFSVWREELVELRQSLGLPRHPTQIIATLRGLPLEQSLLFNLPELQVVIVTVPPCAQLMSPQLLERPWISVVLMASPDDLQSAFQALRRMRLTRISCIGGRTLARALIETGLVQDLYLTTSARTGGEPDTPLTTKPLGGRVVLRKRGTGPDEGVVFEHLVLGR